MHTLEKLKKYEAHLEAHKAYVERGVADPLSNHASEKSPTEFGLDTGGEALMAKMVKDKVNRKEMK